MCAEGTGRIETGPLRRALQSVVSRFPPGQFLRYIAVGGFNTLIGYGVFAALNWLLFRRHVPASYIVATVAANFINIAVAYTGYKLFVFRTKGNWLREWVKAMGVYTSSLLPALVLLPLLVHALTATTHLGHRAPYVANALLTVFGVIYNFIGHKKVTFAGPQRG